MAGSELQADVQADVQAEAIHVEVRTHYAQRAQAAGGSCCGGSSGGSCCGSGSVDYAGSLALYDAAELAALTGDDAASWGCGNPTAIAALQAGEVVLDLGSGGGLDAMLAAAKVGSAGFVYGVDMTDEMLGLARRNAARAGVANVEFRQGQIEALPLPDQSVDVILSNCVINLSPDKGQVLREAFRVLRPGGRFAVSDIVVDGSLAGLPLSEAQIRTALSWSGCIAGALTMDEYKRLLAEAGFAEVEVAVKHRYSLEELGRHMGGVDAALPPAVAEQLVGRFASCDIRARRPVV